LQQTQPLLGEQQSGRVRVHVVILVGRRLRGSDRRNTAKYRQQRGVLPVPHGVFTVDREESPGEGHSIDIVSQRHTVWVYARNATPFGGLKPMKLQYIHLGRPRAL